MIKSIGSLQVDSDWYRLLKENGVGWMFWPPKASLTKFYIAVSSLSGLKTWMSKHLWKAEILELIC